MKLNKIFSWLFVTMMAVSATVVTSCEDQPDKFELTGGTPTVNYIRMPYLAQADSLIDKASLSSVICLVGNNLTSIKELYFNDQKAQLNTSYITDHTLLVQIPATIPAKVTDKIYMVTRDGAKVDYDFHVTVPAPAASSMSCEYAAPGSDVTFYGNYFVDDPNVPLKVTLPDGQEVTSFKSITQSAITFTLPECTTEGAFKVQTVYGESETPFHYLDSRGMLFDFDTPWDGVHVLGNHGWHGRDIINDSYSLKGNYVQLGNGEVKMTEAGGWEDNYFSFEYWCGSWDDPQNVTSGDGVALQYVADFTDYKNMSLKFEMYIPSSNPWCAGGMQIAFMGYDKVTLNGETGGPGKPVNDGYTGYVSGPHTFVFNGEGKRKEDEYGRAIYRPWTTTGSYDTGDKWVTVTIPLSDFNLTNKGASTTTVPNRPSDFSSFTMFVVGGGVNGTECKPIIKIDNIRVVPNK